MLIEFSVTNFRSFRDRQTFSMVAAPRLKKKNCVFEADVDGEKLPGLLKLAAIYGPNASGKSSFLTAMATVNRLVRIKPSSEPIELPVDTFRFSQDLVDKPSVFEIHFIASRCRYEFRVSVTKSRVIEEYLIAYPKGRERLLYERKYNGDGDSYTFGELLEGGAQLHSAWKKLTGPQVLFISQAVANSSEELKQLKIPFEWLRSGFMFVDDDMEDWVKPIKLIGLTEPAAAVEMAEYLRDVDVPVASINFERLNDDGKTVDSKASLDEIGHAIRNYNIRTTFVHETALGRAEFDIKEESKGTRNLLGFFLPWSMKARHGYVVLVDEFDSSLHPKLVAALVLKHLNENTCGQLIFTTHDTHLMDTKMLRRDQFWLTERDAYGATQLRSVHDFEGREGEDIEKRYYEGRYRSLPILSES